MAIFSGPKIKKKFFFRFFHNLEHLLSCLMKAKENLPPLGPFLTEAKCEKMYGYETFFSVHRHSLVYTGRPGL